MSDSQTVVLPLIHLNGTSKEALLNGTCAIGHALRAVLEALREHAPNQRDYYPDPPRAQHARREETVKALYRELLAEAVAISDL